MTETTGTRNAVVIALWLSLGMLALLLGLREIVSLDYWWLLRTGELIAETGVVPKTDVFSYSATGARYIDIHWLFQLGLHGVHRLGGHAGVVAAIGAMVVGLIGILAPIGYRKDRAAISCAALSVMLLLIAPRILPRPGLATFLLLAAVLLLLERFRKRGDAWVFVIPVLQLLWVNLHGLFALGIVLCGMYLGSEVVAWLISGRERAGLSRIYQLTAVTALSLLASLLNPNFVDGALYPVMQLGMIGTARSALSLVSEELAPTLSGSGAPPQTIVLLAALALATLTAWVLNRRRAPLSDALVIISFFFLALSAKRNIALFGIVGAPLLVRNLNEYLDARAASFRIPVAASAGVGVAITGISALLITGNLAGFGHSRALGLGVDTDIHPVEAVTWIESNQPPGPLWHQMWDGGYLIWRLYPDYRVLLDGRLEIYGPERFAAYENRTPEAFRRVDEQFHFGTALLHYDQTGFEALIRWMHESSSWLLAYIDETAAVFVRNAPGRPAGFDELDVDSPDLFPALDSASDRDRVASLKSRIMFYTAVGRYKRALGLWDEALALDPDFAADSPGDVRQQLFMESLEAPRRSEPPAGEH